MNVELPLRGIPEELVGYVQATLRDGLLQRHNTYAAHFPHNGRFWVRCSTQIFNEVSCLAFWSCIECLPTYCLQLRDFEYLGRALLEICAEILENVKSTESEAALTDVQEALHKLSV